MKKGKTKPKKEEVLLVGAEAREMKGLQPLFFFLLSERSNSFNSVIRLVGEGSTLATACTSGGEERESATQQNSCTL